MTTQRQLAIMAGIAYFIIIICGLYSEVFVRMPLQDLLDSGHDSAYAYILGGVFSSGIIADIVMVFCDVLLAMCLFLLFRHEVATASMFALVFRLLQAFTIVSGLVLILSIRLHAIEHSPLANLQLMLALHGYTYDLALVFFAAANLFLAHIVITIQKASKPLAVLLVLTALVYFLGSITRFIAPAINEVIQPAYLICIIGELYFAVWLLRYQPPEINQPTN